MSAARRRGGRGARSLSGRALPPLFCSVLLTQKAKARQSCPPSPHLPHTPSSPLPADARTEGGREDDGVELPQTPPCGPQFGVRRINLFRVGGKEAIGPVSSRCGAERGEPPILHAWACVPSPFPASLSAPLITLLSFSPPQLLEYIFLLLSLASCCPYCCWVPQTIMLSGKLGMGGPHRVYYA